eukprot:7331625-Pyramimonas_sp.AAC.1
MFHRPGFGCYEQWPWPEVPPAFRVISGPLGPSGPRDGAQDAIWASLGTLGTPPAKDIFGNTPWTRLTDLPRSPFCP